MLQVPTSRKLWEYESVGKAQTHFDDLAILPKTAPACSAAIDGTSPVDVQTEAEPSMRSRFVHSLAKHDTKCFFWKYVDRYGFSSSRHLV